MATGGESSPKPKKPIVVTRSSSGAVKPVDYQRMIMGKYRDGASVDEYGFGDSGENQSDPEFYQGATAGAFIQPEVDPFMGNPKSSLSVPRENFDYHLAAEEEELNILRQQLEAAQKEQELLIKRGEADEIRRQLAEQRKANAKLRGMPNDENIVKSKKKATKTVKKQSKSHAPSDDSDVDIQTLRKNKRLRKAVNKELKKLGLTDDISSDSESSDKNSENGSKLKGALESEALPSKSVKHGSVNKSGKPKDSDTSLSYESSDSSSSDAKKKKKKNKKKSGIRAKASDTVHFPEKYPQAYLRYEYTSSSISFEKLDFNLFIAGELEICTSAKIKEVEKSGRPNLLKRIMYLNSSYDFKTLKAFYAACLNEIEIGLKKWDDDFQQIETAILSKHIPKQKFQKKFGNKDKSREDSADSKKSSDEIVWFCSLYQRNKCPQKLSHTERKNGRMHFAQHVCATCWQKDNKKLEHPECSSACPHAKN